MLTVVISVVAMAFAVVIGMIAAVLSQVPHRLLQGAVRVYVESFRNTPRDILTHLGMHSHYHRGQIAILVRRAGSTPAVTDFIVFRRLGR